MYIYTYLFAYIYIYTYLFKYMYLYTLLIWRFQKMHLNTLGHPTSEITTSLIDTQLKIMIAMPHDPDRKLRESDDLGQHKKLGWKLWFGIRIRKLKNFLILKIITGIQNCWNSGRGMYECLVFVLVWFVLLRIKKRHQTFGRLRNYNSEGCRLPDTGWT